MKQELEEQLFAIDPSWFNRDDMKQSLMYFGFECNDGWFRLLKSGMERIKRYIADPWYEHNPDGSYKYEFQVMPIVGPAGVFGLYGGLLEWLAYVLKHQSLITKFSVDHSPFE